MVRTVIDGLICVGLALFGAAAHGQTVFACEPEWAALARVLLPQAQISVATSHQQDPHHIEARPALIAQLRNADMAVCSGAGLEEGWLPVLQQKSGNARVQNGQPGMFWATAGQALVGRQASSGSTRSKPPVFFTRPNSSALCRVTLRPPGRPKARNGSWTSTRPKYSMSALWWVLA